MNLFDYDDNNEQSIYNYAKELEHLTFREILEMYNESPVKQYQSTDEYGFSVQEDSADYTVKEEAKGQLGNVLEKYYFGYRPNGEQMPDFPKVGIELKQTCIDKKKNGKYTAGERLSITNISYNNPVEPDFYKSHVWDKIKRILLVHYLRDRSIERWDYPILFVNLFTPPKEDLKVIIQDYNKINAKIESGLAHELSESDTMYLGACTKGATAESSLRPQYYGDHTLAKKRNFCFKRQYMDYVLNNYVLKNKVPYESIIKNDDELENVSFETYILNKINQHVGKTDVELCREFHREYNNNKAQWNDLAFRMLGIKSNKAAEFEKANIVVKTIRIEENGKNKESMSFPALNFSTFIHEEWEDSTLFNYFDTTQFLFVVFNRKGSFYTLTGAKLWHMPYNDLNNIVQNEWRMYQDTIKNCDSGLLTRIIYDDGHSVVKNALPGMKDTEIIHMRPHAKKAAYKLNDGYMQGDITTDGDRLPNGEWMTKQSFWLNNKYILSQLDV